MRLVGLGLFFIAAGVAWFFVGPRFMAWMLPPRVEWGDAVIDRAMNVWPQRFVGGCLVFFGILFPFGTTR